MPTAKKSGAKTKSPARGRATGSLAPTLLEVPKTPFNPKDFYAETDWEDWYHEYATETVRGGLPKYASTFAFAKAKGSTRQERDFILHVIGPVLQGKGPMYNVKEFPQWDWERRRKDGFWLGPEPLAKQIQQIVEHADSIDELRGSAQVHLLPLLAKIGGMFDKIEASFQGQLFMPNLSDKQNEARASLYMRLVDHVTRSTIQLQEAYARSLCVNVNDLVGTMQMRDSIASKVSGKDAEAGTGFLGKIIEMTVDKAHALKMPLPDPDMERLAKHEVRA